VTPAQAEKIVLAAVAWRDAQRFSYTVRGEQFEKALDRLDAAADALLLAVDEADS